LALSTFSNLSVILPILFVKLAKTPAIAVATLLRAASSTFHLPGETERLFDVPPMVERDLEPPAVAFNLAAVGSSKLCCNSSLDM
jgi:hypothetical protein